MENLEIYYADEYHLSVILVEYLKNKTKERCEIITFFENGIQEQINKIIEKSKIKNKLLEETNFNKKDKIEEIKINTKNKEKEIIIIIQGNKNYIKKVIDKIEKNRTELQNNKIKIIKCYDIKNKENNKNNLQNKKIISTTGEKNI